MERTIEDITGELINLPRRERMEIVKILLSFDAKSSDTAVEESWENEIVERIRAVDEGYATGIDYHEAMKELDRRFPS